MEDFSISGSMIAATDYFLLVQNGDRGLKKYAKLTTGFATYPLIQLAALVERVASILITAAITYLFLILPDKMHIVESLQKWTADSKISYAISGCRGLNNFYRADRTKMENVISVALTLLHGRVDGIQGEAVVDSEGNPDRDHNHKISLTLGAFEEKASTFALKHEGIAKSEKDLVRALVTKINNHLFHRKHEKVFFLPSGALIYSDLDDVTFGVDQGTFTINGKMTLLRPEERLEAEKIQTYTMLRAKQEEGLLIIADAHDERRKDGKEGFVFNLKQTPFLQCHRSRKEACRDT